jgi:hypothetical protein
MFSRSYLAEDQFIHPKPMTPSVLGQIKIGSFVDLQKRSISTRGWGRNFDSTKVAVAKFRAPYLLPGVKIVTFTPI